MIKLIDEELKIIIKERCENQKLYQYIIGCLEYYKSRNEIFYNKLSNVMYDILSSYSDFRFICADKSYFSPSGLLVAISNKKIRFGAYNTFIHEMTHAIHRLKYSNYVPTSYESIRNRIVANDNFMKSVCELMRFIIKTKKIIVEQTVRKIRLANESALLNKINKDIKINEEKNNDINKIDKLNNLLKIINDVPSSFDLESLIGINRRLNIEFESLVDDVRCNLAVSNEFHTLSSMEGMIDSLLQGKIHSGYRTDCFYLEGWGHEEEYFKQKPAFSFMELIADYAVIIAQNDFTLIEIIEGIIGKEMSDLLRNSLNEMIGIDIKEKSSKH